MLLGCTKPCLQAAAGADGVAQQQAGRWKASRYPESKHEPRQLASPAGPCRAACTACKGTRAAGGAGLALQHLQAGATQWNESEHVELAADSSGNLTKNYRMQAESLQQSKYAGSLAVATGAGRKHTDQQVWLLAAASVANAGRMRTGRRFESICRASAVPA